MTNSSGPSSDSSQEPSQPAPELCGGTTGFVMMIVMMLTVFIMFNPELRESIALALDGVFNPIFGFEGKFPTLTLLLSSVFMVFCSTSIRHFLTDWIELARAQKMLSAIQKEKTNAMMARNQVKLKKLEELAPEETNYRMIMTASSFKPLAYTMIFFIIVFPWIWMVYIENLDYSFISLPGIAKWDLQETMDWCIIPWGQWILIYMLLSFPIGFLIQNGLKYITFSRKIRHTEVQQHQKIEEEISDLEEKLKVSQAGNIPVDKPKELLSQAQDKLSERQYGRASNLINEADEYIKNKSQERERVMGLIGEADSMIKNAEAKGIGMAGAIKSLQQARGALKRNDGTSAIYYAKQSQRKVKESRDEHKQAEETISTVKAALYDIRELKTEEADSLFNQAMAAMEKKDYSTVIKYSKSTKTKAEEIKNLHKEAKDAIEGAKHLLDGIKHLGLQIANVEELMTKATQALDKHQYREAIELANKVTDLISSEKDKFQEAQESVSFAKLVISNAQSFGGDVSRAEELVAKAEDALNKKQYERAIELANNAKDIAEQEKRQQQRLSKRK